MSNGEEANLERWEQLFSDLEGSFAAMESDELVALVQEQIRAEEAQIRMWQRCKGAAGQMAEVRVKGGKDLRGKVISAAPEWVLLTMTAKQVLIPMRSIVSFAGPHAVAPVEPEDPALVGRRRATEVTLNRALRVLSRDRAQVTVALVEFAVQGIIASVSSDHITVITGGAGEWEQRRAMRSTAVASAHISYIVGS